MLFWLVQPTFTLNVSSQSRMQPLGWSQQHVVTTTSPRFLQHSTGFQWARELCSRLQCWCGNSTAPSYLNYLWTKCNISRHFLKTLLQLLYPSLMTKLSCQLHHICKYMWHMQPTACDAQLAEQRKMTYKPSKLDQSDLVFSLWSEFVSRSVRANGYGLWHVENVYVRSVGPQRRVSER